MRRFVAGTLSVVLSFFIALPVSFGQSQSSKKTTPSSRKTDSETVLTVDEGPAIKVKAPIRKERRSPSAGRDQDQDQGDAKPADAPTFRATGRPREDRLVRGRPFHGDVRTLPQVPPVKFERPEFEEPAPHPTFYPGGAAATQSTSPSANAPVTGPSAPAPAPSKSFDGLDFTNWGAGHPPDPNGDVGPQYYIQTINTSVGIYDKSNGSRVTAFTFNALMSQGTFGNLCDTDNFGDPVVVYDTFEDRWVITDFAFKLDAGGNILAPAYQCFAVSKSGDPVAGGWNFYSIQLTDAFGDYPKFGVWPDGIYMSANLFGFGAGSSFKSPRVWAFNKAQMYAGNPTVQVVSFDAPSADFTVLPSNARLQAGTPPPGSPNYFVSTEEFLNALTVYKFHVDWNSISLSTFTGPDVPTAATSWPNANVPNAPSLGGNALDVLQIRAMVQNQYTNLGGQESLWTAHTVRRQDTSGFAAPRWYQVNVTGGTVAATLPQATTWDPDGANVVYRFVPSVAVDHAGDMAMGYSVSSSTTKPAIKYAGRLAGDPVNTFSQTEQLLIQGTGTQTGNCGASACIRWGDYSAMTLDPDGCTFWYTNMYYQTDGLAFLTRIGTFSFPSCTPVATGTISGTVTALAGGAPISGATIALGSRTTTTAVDGTYSFTGIPSGTYPSVTAAFPGFVSSTISSVLVTDGAITTVDFSLAAAPSTGCLTDTTQADFQAGVATNCDLTGSPGDVTLVNAPSINQQNTTLGTSGVGITITTWGGQTFTPSVTGQMTRVDINLFCSGCTGTMPNLTLSLRATSGGLPTGADLASATITGFSNAAAVFYTATFSSPPTLTSGTQYALVIRPTVNPAPGTYALTRSGTATAGSDVYAGGTRVAGATSGTVWSIPLTGGVSTDAGFKIFISAGFASSGTFVSSLKDANPAPGVVPTWGTLSWNALTPSNTAIQFQAAASNSSSGPFSFVGPDGTSATFFSNSGSLSQFNGNRYLKYQATLTTTDSTVSPTLHDVTICFNDVAATATHFAVSAPASATAGAAFSFTVTALDQFNNTATGYAGTVHFTSSDGSATLPADSTLTNGTGTFSATLKTAGSQTLTATDTVTASITGTSNTIAVSATTATHFAVSAPGSATAGTAFNFTVTALDQFNNTATGYAGTVHFTSSDGAATVPANSTLTNGTGTFSATLKTTGNQTITATDTVTASITGTSNTIAVSKASQTITFGALAGKNFGDPDFSVTATASSGLAVTFGATGNCSVAGSTVHLTGAGSCTVIASQPGDSNFNAAPDVPQTFPIAKASQTIAFSALTGKTFGDPDFSVGATASSSLAVTFGGSGNCSVAGSTVHITGAGSCTITASQAGDSNYNPATSVPQPFAIAMATQTITFGVLANKLVGDPDFSVSATASSGLAVFFASSGVCGVTGSIVHLGVGPGTCTITAIQSGNANYHPATNVPQSFTVAMPDFSLNLNLPSVTVKAGQSATEHITFAPNPGISNPLTFACSGLPALSTCTFVPSTVPAGSAQVDVVLTISTTAASAAQARSRVFYAAWLPFTGVGLIGIVAIASRKNRKKSRKAAASFAVLALMLLLLLMIGCGGSPTTSGNPGTPAGTSTVTVTGTSGAVSHSTTFSLTVN